MGGGGGSKSPCTQSEASNRHRFLFFSFLFCVFFPWTAQCEWLTIQSSCVVVICITIATIQSSPILHSCSPSSPPLLRHNHTPPQIFASRLLRSLARSLLLLSLLHCYASLQASLFSRSSSLLSAPFDPSHLSVLNPHFAFTEKN